MAEWKRPRPPLLRLRQLRWTSEAWPDSGAGVWIIDGFENLDGRDETWTLRRVMPGRAGGPTGERIKIWRNTYESGGLVVWRSSSDLADPAFTAAGVEGTKNG